MKYLREYQQAHNVNSVPNYQSLKEAKVRLTAQQQSLYDRRQKLTQSIKNMEDGYKLLTQQEHAIHCNLNRNQFYELE